MAIHWFAIDETGRFTTSKNDPSFVCGVVVSCNEECLKEQYQTAFAQLGYGNAPDDTDGIIGDDQFHFNGLNIFAKDICRELLLPFAEKIYISSGKPAVFANNQNWWIVAVTVVISEYLRTEDFNANDTVKIYIDNRNDKTWGIINDGAQIDFKEYHNWMKQQIVGFVKPIADARSVNLDIKFNSDTSNFFINLADLTCGFVRSEREKMLQPIVECNCLKFTSGGGPALVKDNPAMAITLVFQEIANGRYNNIGLVKKNLSSLRNDGEAYIMIWDMFYDLMKSLFAERSFHSRLSEVKGLVEIFKSEFDSHKNKSTGEKRLELMVLFMEYFSHIGSITEPFSADDFKMELCSAKADAETRLLRKWEKQVSFMLHHVQIRFNAYEFGKAVNDFEELWQNQEKIIKALPQFIGCEKDEPTAAIIGSLAQAYAYNGSLSDAIEHFNMSKDYAIKTGSRTASYLFTIYHNMQDIANARAQFEMLTGITPEKYAEVGNFSNNWNLLAYCKLRALELKANGKTALPHVALECLDNYNNEYPFPLIQKWEGIALWLEDSTKNRTLVEQYFSDAINSLLKQENDFAVHTLALPVIQCYAVVNNQNPFHAKYNTILDELKKQSLSFSKFVDEKSAMLNHIKNDCDIWERALSLPFIYA